MKTIKTENYTAEYNDYLDGYVLKFTNGKEGSVQYNTIDNVLDADNGENYLEIYEDGCVDLSDKEYDMLQDFINKYYFKDYLDDRI